MKLTVEYINDLRERFKKAYSEYTHDSPAMPDSLVRLHEEVSQIMGMGTPYSEEFAKLLGSDYICSLEDGSVVSYCPVDMFIIHYPVEQELTLVIGSEIAVELNGKFLNILKNSKGIDDEE